MGFPSQEYWSGLPFPFPGNLPNLGIELRSPAFQVDSSLRSYQGNFSTHSEAKQIETLEFNRGTFISGLSKNGWLMFKTP